MKDNEVILIIDDDPRNIFALELTLRAKGKRVVSCSSAEEGIREMQNNPQIGLVLMDMMMPDMDGYEAMHAIRSHAGLGTVPVVAVTAQAMPGDRERCIAAGARDYIAKPIDLDRLMQVIENLM